MNAIVRRNGSAEALELRAARAELLAQDAGSARELLRFVARLFTAQARAVQALQRAHERQHLRGSLRQDGAQVLPVLSELLREIEPHAASALAEQAHARAAEDDETVLARLELAWSGEPASADDVLSRALLRPYLELLRAEGKLPPRAHTRGRCPFCAGLPAAGCLRGGSTGTADGSEGGGRFLLCGLCGLEWSFARIACPVCAELDPARLPVFRADAHPHVRLDSCESCRTYVKTLDLAQDARRIAEVDELASLSLDLWAAEQGWRRSAPGLAGV